MSSDDGDPAFAQNYARHLAEREAQNYASTRRYTPHPNVIGMLGEKAGAKYFVYRQDLRNRPAGDDGVDVELLLRLPWGEQRWVEVDLKSSAKGDWLLTDANKTAPFRIYVGVAFNKDPAGECIGWEWGHELMRLPTAIWHTGSFNCAQPFGLLRPAAELKAMMIDWRHHKMQKAAA